jgi:16S rRNA processing protein RimM
MPRDLILVGVFGAPHGVRGELRLKSFTADPLAIAGYGLLTDASGERHWRIAQARLVKDDMLVVRVEGIEGRDAAAALTNQRLHVPRDRLPAIADEDEYYHADLIGLPVETPAGAPLGRVAAVLDFGAGDILEITPPDGGRPLMLPFTRAAVPVVDLKAGRLVADPPAEVEGEDRS